MRELRYLLLVLALAPLAALQPAEPAAPSAIRNPNPAEFGKFVEAVGSRYPSVHMFSVWNEPNLVSWLSPQVSGGVPQSPRIYRGLLNAAYGGMQRSGHGGDQLLVGELLPFTR